MRSAAVLLGVVAALTPVLAACGSGGGGTTGAGSTETIAKSTTSATKGLLSCVSGSDCDSKAQACTATDATCLGGCKESGGCVLYILPLNDGGKLIGCHAFRYAADGETGASGSAGASGSTGANGSTGATGAVTTQTATRASPNVPVACAGPSVEIANLDLESVASDLQSASGVSWSNTALRVTGQLENGTLHASTP
jgi:hypothetical protein